MFRVVAAEVAGVDHDAADDSWKAETDDAPIEAWGAAAPAFRPSTCRDRCICLR
jgi:hypothetical protein